MNKPNNRKKYMREYLRKYRKNYQSVFVSRESYDKYMASNPLIEPSRFIERCIELYLTDDTFNLMVSGCSTKTPSATRLVDGVTYELTHEGWTKKNKSDKENH